MADFSVEKTEKTYHLEVVGGNREIHGARIRTDGNGELIVAGEEDDETHHVTLLRPSTNKTTLHVISQDQHKQPQVAGADQSFVTLQGPSGKGEYQLKTAPASDLEPHGLGWKIKHDEWNVLQDSIGRLLLRYKDDACCSSWIAVHEKVGDEEAQIEDEEERWVFWWYAPSGANVEDFERYVLCDIEMVENGVVGEGEDEIEDEETATQ